MRKFARSRGEPLEPSQRASGPLREARAAAAHALAAPIARIIALTALETLGLSGRPFHEPFHAISPCIGRRATV